MLSNKLKNVNRLISNYLSKLIFRLTEFRKLMSECGGEVRVSLFEALESRLICGELEALLAELFYFCVVCVTV